METLTNLHRKIFFTRKKLFTQKVILYIVTNELVLSKETLTNLHRKILFTQEIILYLGTDELVLSKETLTILHRKI
jgi:hypothetical protein